MALVGMSIVEQWYQAVLAGDPGTEVAAKVGGSWESVHVWLRGSTGTVKEAGSLTGTPGGSPCQAKPAIPIVPLASGQVRGGHSYR